MITCLTCRRTSEALIIQRNITKRKVLKDGTEHHFREKTEMKKCAHCNSVNVREATPDERLNVTPLPVKDEGLKLFGA